MIDNLPDAITEIVTDMQTGFIVSDAVAVGSGISVFTYETEENIFVNGMYVSFTSPSTTGDWDDKRYLVTKILKTNSKNYTLQISVEITGLDGISDVLIKPFIKFKYDSWKNIQKRLIEETRDSDLKVNKYPLLVLVIPVEEEWGTGTGIIFETSASFVFITDSRKSYTTAERHEYSMKQKLYPLKDLFLDKLVDSNLFQTDENFLTSHKKKDLPFFSDDEAKTQNKLAAVVDALEITNLNLILKTQSNC